MDPSVVLSVTDTTESSVWTPQYPPQAPKLVTQCYGTSCATHHSGSSGPPGSCLPVCQ